MHSDDSNIIISIIVPIYNVEKYLQDCLSSIQTQSYPNFEVIMVNDGSTDTSGKICDEWVENDKRFKYIYQTNKGLSEARNTGLRNANGNYITFVDSDDFIANNYLELLLNDILDNDSEVAAARIVEVFDTYSVPSACSKQINFSNEEALETVINNRLFKSVVWNKLYSSKLKKLLYNPPGKTHEDEFVTYKVLDAARGLSFCNNAIYFYRKRANSITSDYSLKRLDGLEGIMGRILFLKNRYPKLYLEDKGLFYVGCYQHQSQIMKLDSSERKVCQIKLNEFIHNIDFSWKELTDYNIKTIIFILGVHTNVLIFTSLLNALKRVIKTGKGSDYENSLQIFKKEKS